MTRIPKAVKDATWKKYMGSKNEGKCYCCRIETISVFNFEVGHNKARSQGGSDQIENLRPICKTCNTSMGTQSIESFRKKHFASSTGNPTKGTKKAIKIPVSKQRLNELTLIQLKLLAKKHKVRVNSTLWEDMWGNTTRQAPTKQQYVNKLVGVVFTGEKLQ
jgi:hypothetical protein